MYVKSSQIVPLERKETKVSAPTSEKTKLAVDALFSFKALKKLVTFWASEQVPLMEALCIATTFHVLMFPVVWTMGWALPWPKSPVTTTVIEIDLRNWPREAKPDKVFNYRDPKLNQ